MTGTVAELRGMMNQDTLAGAVTEWYDRYVQQREKKEREWLEVRNYVMAVDVSTTSNSTLPWKNKTHLPKLCQIRDNLHANYMMSLFPNDEWLRWEAYTRDSASSKKAATIQAYMQAKLATSNFYDTISKLLYDYIDYGNAIADVVYVRRTKIDPMSGEEIPDYIGPELRRISPHSIVFNPLAPDFKQSPKVTRYIKSWGEVRKDLHVMVEDVAMLQEMIARREHIMNRAGSFSTEDWKKAIGFAVDGFGDMREYYESGFVEVLEFEGTIYDPITMELYEDMVITVIDRSMVVRKEPMHNWLLGGTKRHVAWRERPDNLYGMGPLDNLVGLQYRLDHLENLKADAMDLAVMPPVALKGAVEEFTWEPLAQVELGEDGEIIELGRNLNGVISAQTEIQYIMNLMEELAGAPKQAMGIRTPGEKTAFEVQTLENAASRIFQVKVSQFEREFLEPLLNLMLQMAQIYLDTEDTIRVLDDDTGVVEFQQVKKADILGNGAIRPIGARHFAARAQLTQNLVGLTSTPFYAKIEPHISGKKLTKLFEDTLGLRRHSIFQDNVSLMEQAETQALANILQRQIMEESMIDPTDEVGVEDADQMDIPPEVGEGEGGVPQGGPGF